MLFAAFGGRGDGVPAGTRTTARVVLTAFAVGVLILLIVGAWSEAGFAVAYGIGFGAVAGWLRDPLHRALPRGPGARLLSFVAISVVVTVTEELLVVALGARVAQPILWLDLLWVSLLWLVWQLAWFRWTPTGGASRFPFSATTAIVVAGASGILFEVVLSRRVFVSPWEALVLAPVAWMIYSAVFTLPAAVLEFPAGPSAPIRTALWAAVGPFLLAVAVALPLVFLLPLLGVPLR